MKEGERREGGGGVKEGGGRVKEGERREGGWESEGGRGERGKGENKSQRLSLQFNGYLPEQGRTRNTYCC